MGDGCRLQPWIFQLNPFFSSRGSHQDMYSRWCFMKTWLCNQNSWISSTSTMVKDIWTINQIESPYYYGNVSHGFSKATQNWLTSFQAFKHNGYNELIEAFCLISMMASWKQPTLHAFQLKDANNHLSINAYQFSRTTNPIQVTANRILRLIACRIPHLSQGSYPQSCIPYFSIRFAL